jgi:hypothetical protein
LSQYDHLFAIGKDKKTTPEYKRYLDSLYEYLFDYIQRVKPLFDLDAEIQSGDVDFEKRWNDGSFPGWPVCKTLTTSFDLLFNLVLFQERSKWGVDQVWSLSRLVCLFIVGRTGIVGA